MYFEIPTQVMFYNEEAWSFGIAYRDEIICGDCGGIHEIAEVIESAQLEDCIEPAIRVLEGWSSL